MSGKDKLNEKYGFKNTWDKLDEDLKRIQEDIERSEELSSYLRSLILFQNDKYIDTDMLSDKEEREG